MLYYWRPWCFTSEDNRFLETTLFYYLIPWCFSPGMVFLFIETMAFSSWRPWRCNRGDNFVLFVPEHSRFLFLDTTVFLLLGTLVFVFLETVVFYFWRPRRFIAADNDVVFLNATVFYSWRPLRFILEDHGVSFMETSVLCC